MTNSKLNQELIEYWSENEARGIIRRAGFVFDAMAEYYGIVRKSQTQNGILGSVTHAKTLEQIGQEYGLTRERIRQIIFKGAATICNNSNNTNNLNPINSINNPYIKVKQVFHEELKDKNFIPLKQIFNNSFFSDFKDNIKGLLSIFDHAEIKQVMYRNEYYLHVKELSNNKIIKVIQNENKEVRHKKTLEHAQTMAKTVTYVPEYIRNNLIKIADEKDQKLNNLYRNILNTFIEQKPYLNNITFFSKKESWRIPKMKKAWVQVGLYIDRELFERCETLANSSNTSVMNFIGCAFAWYSLKNTPLPNIT